MNKYLSFIFLFYAAVSFGQIGMHDWRIHFSAFNAKGVASNASGIFMACSNGIIHHDLEDNSVNMLTVTNGLSDLGISSIAGNGEQIMLGYQNGNLDLIDGNIITNIPWIKLAELSGDKTVHASYFHGDSIYICTGVGMVVYNLQRNEIADTYYPYANPTIYDATVFRDTLYLATNNGIYYAHYQRNFLNDLNQWTKFDQVPGTTINGPFTQIETFNDQLVFLYKSTVFDADTLYYYDGINLNKYPETPTTFDIHAQEDRLIISIYSSLIVLDESMNVIETIFDYSESSAPEPRGAIYKEGNYWISDANHGLVRALNTWNNESIFKNSPFTDGSYRMDIQFGKVLVAGGGLTENLINNFYRNGVYLFENETWTNFNYETEETIGENSDFDFISVAINFNNTDEMAFASYSEGGIKMIKDGKTISEVYNELNSPLEVAANGFINVADMKYDDAGNLWVVNQGLEPLKVLTPDGQWYSFSLGSASKNQVPYRLLIDANGNKWVCVNHVGLVAFNENGTLDDPSDDQLQTLNQSEGSGNLPSNYVRSIAEDRDGEIWIGTEMGLVVLYNTSNVYDGGYGDFDANEILLEVNGEVEKLLGETNISAIAVDGGNRKWIGTSSSGIFCLSPEGTKEIYRFTQENSPLISNSILDIRVDHLSGEVFIATDKGLVSFRSDATIEDDEFDNVTVFPNPVEPGFTGPITIQGLGYESDVKITDISGNLVYKGYSNGGTFIWDGKTLYGDRVQSGVYLVWSGISSGKGKNVAKILFIN